VNDKELLRSDVATLVTEINKNEHVSSCI